MDNDAKPPAKKVGHKRIFIAIPTGSGWMHHWVVHSLIDLAADCARIEHEGYQFMFIDLPRMLIAQARELAVEKALEYDCDYILFIDDDHPFIPKGIVKRLLNHDKDIVGVLSFERLGDHHPNIYMMAGYNKAPDGNAEMRSVRYVNLYDYEGRPNNDGLIEVDAVGFGMCMLNMRIFKGPNAIKPPYFMSQWQIGEDFWFCMRAKEQGYQVWADTKKEFQLPHIGEPELIIEDLYKKHMKKNIQIEKSKPDASKEALEWMEAVVNGKEALDHADFKLRSKWNVDGSLVKEVD